MDIMTPTTIAHGAWEYTLMVATSATPIVKSETARTRSTICDQREGAHQHEQLPGADHYAARWLPPAFCTQTSLRIKSGPVGALHAIGPEALARRRSTGGGFAADAKRVKPRGDSAPCLALALALALAPLAVVAPPAHGG
eukprot:2322478-Pleurochrysis_carterae.AAC.3